MGFSHHFQPTHTSGRCIETAVEICRVFNCGLCIDRQLGDVGRVSVTDPLRSAGGTMMGYAPFISSGFVCIINGRTGGREVLIYVA